MIRNFILRLPVVIFGVQLSKALTHCSAIKQRPGIFTNLVLAKWPGKNENLFLEMRWVDFFQI